MSIIIIGVGSADFTKMEQLDGDTNPIFSHKHDKYATRDIVQFVPFNQYKDDYNGLVKEVLHELPKQMTDYFQGKNVTPNLKGHHVKPQMIQGGNGVDIFYTAKKEELVKKLTSFGYNENNVRKFLSEKDQYGMGKVPINDHNVIASHSSFQVYINF